MARPASPPGVVAPYQYLDEATKDAICEALAHRRCPTVSAAVRHVLGDDRRLPTVLAAIRNDPAGFGQAVERAKETFRDSLRTEVVRRGRDGYSKAVTFKGEVTAHVTEYSDALLIAACRLALPEFLDRRVAGDITHHVAEEAAGRLYIDDAEVLALPEQLKDKLKDVLKHVQAERRRMARQQQEFNGLEDQSSEVEDAEFSEITADEESDPFDLSEVAKLR